MSNPNPPQAATGTPVTVDRAKRWERILEISKEIAYRDEPPNEVESALCGAVVRAREFAERIVTLERELNETKDKLDAALSRTKS